MMQLGLPGWPRCSRVSGILGVGGCRGRRSISQTVRVRFKHVLVGEMLHDIITWLTPPNAPRPPMLIPMLMHF